MSRSITGLNPIQSVICTTLDVVDQISINGKVPTTLKYLAYDPTTKTTKYVTISDFNEDVTIHEDLYVTGESFMYGGLSTGGAQLSCGELNASGNVIKFTNLPTSNPNNAGQLWNDNGTLMVS